MFRAGEMCSQTWHRPAIADWQAVSQHFPAAPAEPSLSAIQQGARCLVSEVTLDSS